MDMFRQDGSVMEEASERDEEMEAKKERICSDFGEDEQSDAEGSVLFFISKQKGEGVQLEVNAQLHRTSTVRTLNSFHHKSDFWTSTAEEQISGGRPKQEPEATMYQCPPLSKGRSTQLSGGIVFSKTRPFP